MRYLEILTLFHDSTGLVSCSGKKLYLKIEQSHLAQIGIENCKMNLEEPTLIYVCACCRSKNPNKSPKRKDFTRTFLICSFLKNR